MSKKPKAIIVDLDGTIIEWEMKPDWCTHTADKDKPIADTCKLLQAINDNTMAIRIVILTARPECCRNEVIEFLDNNEIYVDEIVMSADSDTRHAVFFKSDEIDKLKEKYEIICALEDDTKNTQMMTDRGITVLQVRRDGKYS